MLQSIDIHLFALQFGFFINLHHEINKTGKLKFTVIMVKFRLANNILGWVVFLISAVVYLLTLEPTVSLWDCGEFISSAFKLQIGHPPGAPLL